MDPTPYPSYLPHPTPPYYSNNSQTTNISNNYLPSSKHAYTSSSFPSNPQQQQQQQQYRHAYVHEQQLQQLPLVINTKLEATMQHSNNNNRQNNSVSAPPLPHPSSNNNNNTDKNTTTKEQLQTTAQLADFAAHMVCYLLFGHRGSSSSSSRSNINDSRTPPASIPTSPLPGQGFMTSPSSFPYHIHGHHHHSTSSSCPCEICTLTDSSAYRSIHASSFSSSGHPTRNQQQQQQQHQQHRHYNRRPTHRRILSESDIVQPRPMFRKFCLDVLSATLLSPSVILLSLKYVQQLMINLKENNKTPSTGEGSEFRLFTGALILANKFLDDNTFTNRTWANITGISVKEVNYIELQFLQGINFRLFTSSCDYTEWLASLTHFTGKYMPSQYVVAFQQQTVAALSPISPMDPTEPLLPTATETADLLATPPPIMQDRGSAWGSACGGTSHGSQGIDQSSYRSEAPISLSAGAGLAGAGAATGSIPQYTTSAKQAQQRPCSGYRFQRVPAAAPTTLPSAIAPTSSSSCSSAPYHLGATTQPHCNPMATLESRQQQQQHASGLMGSYQGSSAPSSSAWSSPSTSSTPYAYQPRYLEATQAVAPPRKRSATIAFDEIMDRSPCYESGTAPGALLSANPTPASTLSHKRVSSSSSMVNMMGELSTAPSMFQAGYSPVVQSTRVVHHHYQSLTPTTATVPSQRVSTGTMPVPYRGQHHRNASGSHCINVSGYTAVTQEPVHMGSVPSRAGGRMHPLDLEDRPQSFYHSYYVPSQQHAYGGYDYSARTPPYYYSSPRDYNHNHQQHRSRSSYHAPSREHRDRGGDVEMRGVATTGGGSSPYYEIDPRFYGPLDNLSLYAMTTQAAKRVFAQSKALAASTHGLSAYYPTTPA